MRLRRKSLLLAVGMLLLIGGGLLAGLVALTQHEPAFYARCAIPAGKQRQEVSDNFVFRFKNFTDYIGAGGDPKTGNWRASFTEVEINSFFAEAFASSKVADRLLPEGMSDPRVQIEQDRVRLGFRYGSSAWSTIVSVDFRVWLAKQEPNVVVMELQRLHAGALPISAQSLLEEISQMLSRQNIQVTWYRHNGNPAAAIRFQTDQPQPAAQLQVLELKPGMITVAGHTSEPLPRSVPSVPGARN